MTSWSSSRPTTSATTCRCSPRASSRTPASAARRRRRVAGRHRRGRRRAGARSIPGASRSCTAPARAASAARTSTACSTRSSEGATSSARWTPTCRTTPSTCPTSRGRGDHDVVIGSRYLNGVSVVNWPLHRIFLSAFANRYIRAVTGCLGDRLHQRLPLLAPRGARAAAARQHGLGRLRVPRRDAVRSARRGCRIGEVPIIFVERPQGQSKVSARC